MRGAPWTDDANNTLRDLAAQGMTIDNISKTMGRTEKAISAQALRLLTKITSLASWPPPLEKRLRELFSTGISYLEIAAELGITRSAVAGKVHRLGLPTRRLSPGVPRIRVRRERPK